jgi:tRNA nucleotidyltransferase/poly(A) polymerase
MSSESSLPVALVQLLPSLQEDTPVWLVGGAVRDKLLGLESLDLDFVVDGDALALARRVADRFGGHYFPLDPQRETGRAILPHDGGKRLTCDFARMRGSDIGEDLRGRDFTINALAIHLQPPFRRIDPLGGAADLRAGRLRACTDSALVEDPIRMLRAVRLAIQFELKIEPESLVAIKQAASLLETASPERTRDELFSILGGNHPGSAIRLMDHLGLLFHGLKELAELKGRPLPAPIAFAGLNFSISIAGRLDQLLSVLQQEHDPEAAAEISLAQVAFRLGRFRGQIHRFLESVLSTDRCVRPLIFFGGLYLPSGYPHHRVEIGDSPVEEELYRRSAELATERARWLRLSNVEVDFVANLLRHQPGSGLVNFTEAGHPLAIYRFFRDVGEAGIGVVLLSLAEFLGAYTPPVPQNAWAQRLDAARTLLSAYFEYHDRIIDPPALVRGGELMKALGLPPGERIGQTLEAIREAQVLGEVADHQQALEFARRWLNKPEDEPAG